METIVNSRSFPDLPPLAPKLEPWIETYTGKVFHFLSPALEEIDIEDIAHSLANECRFGGHTSEFYSVAEHSVLVATLLPDDLALAGLLHDASEAYIRDIASPVKQYLSNYKDIETVIQDAVHHKFGVKFSPEIKEADTLALKAEAQQLLPSKGESWLHLYPTKTELWKQIKVRCLEPKSAKRMFLQVFEHLTGVNEMKVWTPPEAKVIIAR